MSGKSKKRGNSKSKDHGQTKKATPPKENNNNNNDNNKQLQKQVTTELPDVTGLWQYEIYDQTMPQEKVGKVKPYWSKLNQDERESMLRLSLDELRAQAQELTYRSRQRMEQTLQTAEKGLPLILENFVEVLETGVQRLKEKGTWKLWEWEDKKGDKKSFTDMESFRTYVEENHMSDSMKALMIKDDSKMETKAETALRKRMQEVLNHVQNQTKQFQDELQGNRKLFIVPKGQANASGATNSRVDVNQIILEKNVQLTKYMLTAVGKEHELLNQSILMPVIEYIMEVLPDSKRRTTHRDLAYEDLDQLKLPEIGNICEWLTEKVDGLTAKWKLDPELDEEEEEDEVMGDIDLFQLSEDHKDLVINRKWLEHLQDRTLSPDGNPRKSKLEEDPHKVGLLLEWIYGSIVSTAEKAREGAKRILSTKMPDANAAFQTLLTGLKEYKGWRECSTERQELIAQLDNLKEQLQGVDLCRVPVSGPEDQQSPLPQQHIYAVLKREYCLQEAKELHMKFGIAGLTKDQVNLSVEIRQHENQMSKYGSMLEVLRLRSDMITYQQGGNTVNTQQLATEQLEVQAHLNATRTALSQLHHKKAKLENQKQAKEKEVSDIKQCKQALKQLLDKIEQIKKAESEGSQLDLDSMNDHDLLVFNDAHPDSAMQCIGEYFENFWHCAITMRGEEESLRSKMKSELDTSDEKCDDLKAVLGHLEMHFLNVSCDDPGTTIGVWIALPMLQDRLDNKTFEFANQLAEEAQSQMLKIVEEETVKQQQSRERKSSKKAKLKEKERALREKIEAERVAQEKAQKQAEIQAKLLQQEQQELERKKREEEAVRLRLEEEEALEQRRQQLLDGEDNHWKQRMQELQMQKWLSSTLSNEEVEEAAREADQTHDLQDLQSTIQQQDVENGYASDRDIVVEKRYQKVDKNRRSVKLPNKRNYDRNRGVNIKQHREDPLKGNRGSNYQHQHHANSSSDWNQDKHNRRNSHPPLRKQSTRNSNATTASSTQNSSIDEKDVVIITSVQSAPLINKNSGVVDDTSVVEYTFGQQSKEDYQEEKQYMQYSEQQEYMVVEVQQEQQLQQEHLQQQFSKELVQADDRTVSTDSCPPQVILPDFEQAGVGIEIKPIPPSTPPIYPYPPAEFPPMHPHPHPHPLTSHHSLPVLTQPPMVPPMANFGGPPPPMPPGIPNQFFPPGAGSAPLPFPPPWALPLPQFQMQGQGFCVPPPPGQFPPPFAPPHAFQPPPAEVAVHPPPQEHAPLQLPKKLNPGAKEFVPFDSDNQDTTNSPVSDNSSATNFNYAMEQNQENFETLMEQVESKCDPQLDITKPKKLAPKILVPIEKSSQKVQQPVHKLDTDISQIQERLNLVRGLTNQTGQSNCFVNVLVQSLWHLKAFRSAMLSIRHKDLPDVTNADGKVFLAMWDMFQAFGRPLTSKNISNDNAEDTTIVRSESQDWSLSAKDLKTALSELTSGNFVLDEMHDACEVLGEILVCMYRSQSGNRQNEPNSTDPFLPRNLSLKEEKSVCNIDPQNLVARFFGLDVRSLASDGEQQQYYSQYLKFFHFIPAKGLREAAKIHRSYESFETILNCAEQFEQIPENEQLNPSLQKRTKLSCLPGVFTIALVWESPNVLKSEIDATMDAINMELDLSQLFDGLDDFNLQGGLTSTSYYMQCLVCYYRHHYYAFAFLEELDKWLLFDDTKIQVIGEFRKVQDMIVKEGWQPILFFYEQDNSV